MRRVLLAALLVTCSAVACSTPVGVDRLSPARAQALLTRNILTSGEVSGPTANVLRVTGLAREWKRDPVAALEAIHGPLVAAGRGGQPIACRAMVAAAELAFAHAMETDDRAWFVTAAIYAWAALFPAPPAEAGHACSLDPFDSRLRLAADLYNRGITLAFADSDGEIRLGEIESLALPIGELELAVDPEALRWGNRPLQSFVAVTDLEVRGLKNRYRQPGIGAPLAAGLGPAPDGDANVDLKYLPPSVKVAVSAVLVFDDVWEGFERRHFTAQLEVESFDGAETLEVHGRQIPLEMEPTAALAYSLTESNPWSRELKGFFQGDLVEGTSGLVTIAPYRHGRTPVILVHGTASSAGRWADLINDLRADEKLRQTYQFWFFQYNTGNPILYSSWLLRQAIDEMLHTLDPDRSDPAMSRIVVMGHSQGGLLAKLTAVDSGNRFWQHVSDVPPEEADLSPGSRQILEGSLLVRPVPEVTRVIYLSTPHRGSYLATLGPARWVSRMTRAPANLFIAATDLLTQDDEGKAVRRVDRLSSAVDDMTPGSRFLETLLALHVEPPAVEHSIISVKGDDPLDRANDGVVAYTSAHLDGVETERIVASGHSSQSNPAVISEVRRILLEHVGLDAEAGYREIFRGETTPSVMDPASPGMNPGTNPGTGDAPGE